MYFIWGTCTITNQKYPGQCPTNLPLLLIYLQDLSVYRIHQKHAIYTSTCSQKVNSKNWMEIDMNLWSFCIDLELNSQYYKNNSIFPLCKETYSRPLAKCFVTPGMCRSRVEVDLFKKIWPHSLIGIYWNFSLFHFFGY